MCERWQSGNGCVCVAHRICDARRALLLLLLLFRVHNSIDFNGIHARIRNLFNFDAIFISALNPNQMHGHTRTTQKQRSRDEMWKRTRLGSSVRTNRLYYYFFRKNWVNDCMRQWRLVDGWKRKQPKETNCVQGSNDESNRHKTCNYLPNIHI